MIATVYISCCDEFPNLLKNLNIFFAVFFWKDRSIASYYLHLVEDKRFYCSFLNEFWARVTIHFINSGTPPYDQPVITTTFLWPELQRPTHFLIWKPRSSDSTPLIRPHFVGPTVVVLTGCHRATKLIGSFSSLSIKLSTGTHQFPNYWSTYPGTDPDKLQIY